MRRRGINHLRLFSRELATPQSNESLAGDCDALVPRVSTFHLIKTSRPSSDPLILSFLFSHSKGGKTSSVPNRGESHKRGFQTVHAAT